VLHVGSSNVESEEEQEVEVDVAGELEVALSELSEGLGLVGVASKEEGETANDHIGTNEDGSVSLHLIFLLEHEVGACSGAGNEDEPQKDGAALDEHGENETVEEEAEEETGDATKDT
jgi:hypothetical protein